MACSNDHISEFEQHAQARSGQRNKRQNQRSRAPARISRELFMATCQMKEPPNEIPPYSSKQKLPQNLNDRHHALFTWSKSHHQQLSAVFQGPSTASPRIRQETHLRDTRCWMCSVTQAAAPATAPQNPLPTRRTPTAFLLDDGDAVEVTPCVTSSSASPSTDLLSSKRSVATTMKPTVRPFCVTQQRRPLYFRATATQTSCAGPAETEPDEVRNHHIPTTS